MRTSCIPSANSSIAFVSASPGLSHRKDTPPSPETVVCTDIMYDNDQTLKIAAAITATLRALSCHVFAPFALIFSARFHAQVGESQLELLVLHCDTRALGHASSQHARAPRLIDVPMPLSRPPHTWAVGINCVLKLSRFRVFCGHAIGTMRNACPWSTGCLI